MTAARGAAGDRWEGGFAYAPENCGSAGIVDACGDEEKIIDGNAPEVAFEPFVIWAGDKCTTFGFDDRDWQGRAERQLEACASQQIEREFWRGDFAQAVEDRPNRFLAAPDAVELSVDALSALAALAALEDGLAGCSCGGRGMVHATPGVVTLWNELGLLRREANLILTVLDTIIVPGSGYDGSGPDGQEAADGGVWAYGTGLVDVRRGQVSTVPDNLREATDTATNTIEYRAEQFAAATWDGCCHVAVEIDAPDPSPPVGS